MKTEIHLSHRPGIEAAWLRSSAAAKGSWINHALSRFVKHFLGTRVWREGSHQGGFHRKLKFTVLRGMIEWGSGLWDSRDGALGDTGLFGQRRKRLLCIRTAWAGMPMLKAWYMVTPWNIWVSHRAQETHGVFRERCYCLSRKLLKWSVRLSSGWTPGFPQYQLWVQCPGLVQIHQDDTIYGKHHFVYLLESGDDLAIGRDGLLGLEKSVLQNEN